jgi:hypothetical protein
MGIKDIFYMVNYIIAKYIFIYRPINSGGRKLYLLSRIKYIAKLQMYSEYHCWFLTVKVVKYLKFNYLKLCKNFGKTVLNIKCVSRF